MDLYPQRVFFFLIGPRAQYHHLYTRQWKIADFLTGQPSFEQIVKYSEFHDRKSSRNRRIFPTSEGPYIIRF